MKPTVSIYIPSRNYGRYLEQAIRSVLSQLYTCWELFIVDEASSDETKNIALYYSQKYPEKITYIYNEAPVGLQKMANSIISKAKGKYLMRLDADDWLEDYAVLVLQAKLESNQDLELAYGNFYYVDEDGHVLGAERRLEHGREDLSGNLPPHGACTLIRVRTLKSIGGYEEGVNAQDGWDIWYKLYQKGRIGAVGAPIFFYRQHSDSMSRSKDRLLKARSQILSNARSRISNDYSLQTLAVIPVRESYGKEQGVPYHEVDGCSLLKNAILAAHNSKEVTHIVVTSESEGVLQYCRDLELQGQLPMHYRYRRTHGRNEETLQVVEVLRDACEYVEKSFAVNLDIVLCMSIHSFRRNSQHVDNAVDLLLLSESDSVLSVQEIREPVLQHGKFGLEVLNMGKFDRLTYERECLYRFNGAIIALWADILGGALPFGEKIGYMEMSHNESLVYEADGR